ncbi:hypothetical protein HNR46_003667 [Haloferula luteola]|uniref:Uncharacterized protein n=1 Tax=Haloferula luteola TaxID=595692 RepID=A0A840VHU8_9BACT|nr:hypothetical protein [Haloferula luteola]
MKASVQSLVVGLQIPAPILLAKHVHPASGTWFESPV